MGSNDSIGKQSNFETPQILKDLSDAATIQAKVANRLWVFMIFLSLLALLPRPVSIDGGRGAELPFKLGTVDQTYFYLAIFLMLSVMVIAFCVAHAQQLRVTILSHKILDQMNSGSAVQETVHIKDLFDALRIPSFSRVAPLAQIARGKYQFYTTKDDCPRWLVNTTAIYYLYLKILATSVYFFLPAFALYLAFSKCNTDPVVLESFGIIPSLAMYIFGIGAAMSLIQISYYEIKYIFSAMGAISKS